MFRKVKRKTKDVQRRKADEDSDEGNDGSGDTSDLLSDARKRIKQSTLSQHPSSQLETASSQTILDSFASTKVEPMRTIAELVTSTVDHVPKTLTSDDNPGEDGIFRNRQRNKLLAGPLKAAPNVRSTVRFDYEPNICKDYKETGFCGFGDTCIYLHDRSDTLTGWQLEEEWQKQQALKKKQNEQDMNEFIATMNAQLEGRSITTGDSFNSKDDGLPFACYICRNPFYQPVVTNCSHYFCESCIMEYVRTTSEACPVCGRDTNSVFGAPVKLIAKKRKVLGQSAAQAEDSWKEFALIMRKDP